MKIVSVFCLSACDSLVPCKTGEDIKHSVKMRNDMLTGYSHNKERMIYHEKKDYCRKLEDE